ncbi:MAG: hypothetical protein RL328_1831, partial [Acidobacteriota bacterium]
MAGTTGLEPATSDVTGRRSNQLNYVPAFADESAITKIPQAGGVARFRGATFFGLRGL